MPQIFEAKFYLFHSFFSVWTHGTRRQKLQEEEWCDRKFDDIQTSIHPDISHLYYNLHCLQAVAELTSSAAVTKRLCDASCLSVVSFNCTIPRVQFFQLLVYNSILFCCLRHNVEPCCHTHDSRTTVTVYSARPWLLIARGGVARLVVRYPQSTKTRRQVW